MKVERLFNVLRGPHVTEKTTRVGDESNQYGFKVAKDATKAEIKEAVEKLFEVTVLKVTTINYKGKRKRRINGRINQGKGWKKAYVRILPDEVIDLTELG